MQSSRSSAGGAAEHDPVGQGAGGDADHDSLQLHLKRARVGAAKGPTLQNGHAKVGAAKGPTLQNGHVPVLQLLV